MTLDPYKQCWTVELRMEDDPTCVLVLKDFKATASVSFEGSEASSVAALQLLG
jgi:hypothetical protein